MDQDSYSKMLSLLKDTKTVKAEAQVFRKIMLDEQIGSKSQVAEFASVHPVDGSEFDFEIRCDQRRILAHYSRLNKDESDRIKPFGRYQFLLYADALPGAILEAPEQLLEIEFGRSGEFELAGNDYYCSPSIDFQEAMRNQVLVEVVNQLQDNLRNTTFNINM